MTEMNHADVPMTQSEIQLEARFIEQEHRAPMVLLNMLECRRLDPTDPRKRAARRALIFRLLSPSVWVVATSGIGVLSLIGLLLAFQANQLIGEQNQKLDQQTYLAEASRRAGLVAEFAAIAELIGKESASARQRARDSTEKPSRYFVLEETTMSRIRALAMVARPYRYLDFEQLNHIRVRDAVTEPGTKGNSVRGATLGWLAELLGLARVDDSLGRPQLIERPLSPERGQLFSFLVESGVDLGRGSFDFPQADLRDAIVFRAKADPVDLRNSELYKAVIRESELRGAILIGANLREACVVKVNLQHGFLMGADLRGAALIEVWLPSGRNLAGAVVDTHTTLDLSYSEDQNWFVEARTWATESLRQLLDTYVFENDFDKTSGKQVYRLKPRQKDGRAYPKSCEKEI
jgi:hypothetical protein